MRMMKKLIAAISSLAMIATMASAVVVHAADQITLEPVLTQTSEGVYDLAINLDATGCAKGTKVCNIQFSIALDSAIFDVANGPMKTESVWSDDDFDYVTTYPNFTGVAKFANYKPAYNNGLLTYAFVPTGADGIQNLPRKAAIVTFKNLKLLDGVSTGDIEIALTNVAATVGASFADSTAYKGDNVVTTTATFPGNKVTPAKPSVPTNTGATADSSAILNVKPSDVGGTGDVWASADGSENAVAGLANFTPSAATSTIEWTISATPVGGEATQYTKAFDLGASIDAAATIGLIVNYNTAEYSSVSIVSGALK